MNYDRFKASLRLHQIICDVIKRYNTHNFEQILYLNSLLSTIGISIRFS